MYADVATKKQAGLLTTRHMQAMRLMHVASTSLDDLRDNWEARTRTRKASEKLITLQLRSIMDAASPVYIHVQRRIMRHNYKASSGRGKGPTRINGTCGQKGHHY